MKGGFGYPTVMSQAILIRAELDSVRSDLKETFPHLNDDLINWAPAPGMRTVQGQFVEMISTERSILDRLEGIPSGDPEVEDAPLWAAESIPDLIDLLNETRARTLHLLAGYTDENLGKSVPTSEGFAQYLCLDAVPAAELFRFIARHESYHAGQLVSYLWARGDDPYGWEQSSP